MKIQDIIVISDSMLSELHEKARESERLRINFDLRTTEEDTSQRMLNVLEPGTKVPIHRHLNTSETVVCLEGCLEWVFYEELPSSDSGCPTHDGEFVIDEKAFVEVASSRICPREKKYGIHIPPMIWHSLIVHEPSTIVEAKDGKYGE